MSNCSRYREVGDDFAEQLRAAKRLNSLRERLAFLRH